MEAITTIGAVITAAIAGVATLILAYNYEQHKASIARGKLLAQDLRAKELRGVFETWKSKIAAYPDNKTYHASAVASATMQRQSNTAFEELYELAKVNLAEHPMLENVRSFTFAMANLVPGDLAELYELTLTLLTNKSDTAVMRVFALQVGRLHRGRSREDGRVTIYDEQAIQNDIMVRCGHMVPVVS